MRFDSRKRAFAGLVVFLIMCFAVASVGAAFPPGAWYQGLVKPSFNPPAWVFGPVWTLLYALMAVAAWRVWCDGSFREHRIALGLFVTQLAVNGLWSVLFFGLHRMDLALIDLAVLWLLIAATSWRFLRIDRVAGYLMLPYLAWVSFAAVLNASLIALQP